MTKSELEKKVLELEKQLSESNDKCEELILQVEESLEISGLAVDIKAENDALKEELDNTIKCSCPDKSEDEEVLDAFVESVFLSLIKIEDSTSLQETRVIALKGKALSIVKTFRSK